ncbi:hypothetical protein [Alkaliphilus oremlandii]|uniref:hypothetical protein n=1 Tax=Alkaliphilus oremlandii TaxID=461876 RepID=UPI0000D8259B|nr:hypothetical protein [Alkaliphilus oremlandii]
MEIHPNKTYREIKGMEQDFVAMTPSFTKDGEKLLYSATEAIDESMSFNYSKAFEDWKNKAHHIYDYDLKTGQRF